MHEKSIYSAVVPVLYQNGTQAKPILNTLKLQREEKRNGKKRTETENYLKG